MPINKNEYVTKDLHFAGFLKLKGLDLLAIKLASKIFSDKNWRSHKFSKEPFYFVFDDLEKCEDLENTYWEGEGDEVMVNIKDYINTVRGLRSRIFAIRK